jgi:hypothetical protein
LLTPFGARWTTVKCRSKSVVARLITVPK